MKTIQITIDEELLNAVDTAVETLATTRLAFICNALREALHNYEMLQLERQHAAGYEQKLLESYGFDVWDGEREWGEA
jgi:metal-responsive CopG/Arc/MetJ family transcriptional regulator